ncbi:MAG: hypothetical protein AAB866_02020, partial [Patescibacteria group bacterium]
MDPLQITIKEKFNELPQNVKEAILSVDLPQKIQAIANKYALHLDQAGTIETEVTLVLLGLEKANNFAQNIKKELAISEDIANKIASDVSDEIFQEIRESLQEMTDKDETES